MFTTVLLYTINMFCTAIKYFFSGINHNDISIVKLVLNMKAQSSNSWYSFLKRIADYIEFDIIRNRKCTRVPNTVFYKLKSLCELVFISKIKAANKLQLYTQK